MPTTPDTHPSRSKFKWIAMVIIAVIALLVYAVANSDSSSSSPTSSYQGPTP